MQITNSNETSLGELVAEQVTKYQTQQANRKSCKPPQRRCIQNGPKRE